MASFHLGVLPLAQSTLVYIRLNLALRVALEDHRDTEELLTIALMALANSQRVDKVLYFHPTQEVTVHCPFELEA
jgi:hypothetical protein